MNRKITLKKNHDIEKLVKMKKSVGNAFYAIYYKAADEKKIAISVSKKLGKAVLRNYQKRVVKEILRINFSLVGDYHFLLVIKKSSFALSYQKKEIEIIKLLEKMKVGKTNEKRD